MDLISENIAKAVRQYHSGAESGHGWWHIERVMKTAMLIQRAEGYGNPQVVEIAALVHDVGDYKLTGSGDDSTMVKRILDESGLSEEIISKVLYIHKFISFRSSLKGSVERTPELDIVQDADRLDAIGAIGIARAFSFGGSRGSEIYVPDEKPMKIDSFESYRRSGSNVINHFYEKLLTLKNRMNTATGAAMAADRHQFMELYLEQFYKELNTPIYLQE